MSCDKSLKAVTETCMPSGLSQGDLNQRLNEFDRLFNPKKSDLEKLIENTREKLTKDQFRKLY